MRWCLVVRRTLSFLCSASVALGGGLLIQNGPSEFLNLGMFTERSTCSHQFNPCILMFLNRILSSKNINKSSHHFSYLSFFFFFIRDLHYVSYL